MEFKNYYALTSPPLDSRIQTQQFTKYRNNCITVLSSMSTTIPPSNTRKSGRKVRKPDRINDAVTTPNPKGIVTKPTHVLMSTKVTTKRTIPTSTTRVTAVKPVTPSTLTKVSRDETDTYSSSDEDGYHLSDNYSRLQLYKNWIVSKDLVKEGKITNKDLIAVVYKLSLIHI